MKILIMVLIVALTFAGRLAIAAAPSSPDYQVQADTVSGGGGVSLSADYTNEASLGGIAGDSVSTGNIIRLGHGYIHQRREPKTVLVTASPFLVEERGSSQLEATAILDDDSRLLLNGAALTWRLDSGPVAQVDTSGLVQMGTVYQITLAGIQGRFNGATGSVTLAVLNVEDDDFGSYGGDGLNDAWQVINFGEQNPNAMPLADPDEDAYSNAAEYLAGTDPRDAASHFTLRILRSAPSASILLLGFSPCRSDRTYTIEKRVNWDEGEFTPVGQPIRGVGLAEYVASDPTATNSTGFYRIRIAKP